jgi:hypothetical protein
VNCPYVCGSSSSSKTRDHTHRVENADADDDDDGVALGEGVSCPVDDHHESPKQEEEQRKMETRILNYSRNFDSAPFRNPICCF